ncbi:hypothetical protein ACIPCF_19505 (plasmid) [Paracoccus marcusii]
MMRGTDEASGSLFSYVDLEARIPARHPLRKIRHVNGGVKTGHAAAQNQASGGAPSAMARALPK